MLAVLTCLESDHDPWLTGLAVIVCLIGCLVTVRIISRAREATHQPSDGVGRHVWPAGAGVAFGATVWATHFVAMLAYAPAIGAHFSMALTAISLVVAIGGSLVVFAGVLPRIWSTGGSAIAGVLLGSTIFAMHRIGMQAIDIAGIVEHDWSLVLASWLIGSLAATAASWLIVSRPAMSAGLLVLSVCGLHFTGMASLTIFRFGAAEPHAAANLPLAIAVAAVCLLILLPGLAGVIFDQHLARRSEQEASRLREFASASFEGIVFHHHGVITDINVALCNMLGRNAAELIGKSVVALFAPESHARVARALAATTAKAIDATLLGAGGLTLPAELLGRVTLQNSGSAWGGPTGVLGIRDLTERRAVERQIAHLAHYDTLTGLGNRSLFQERLAEALEDATRAATGVALLWIDLDRFKSVNDLLGHPVGDQLLAQVASRIEAPVRSTDTVARLGGDEFVVLMPGASRRDASDLAHRLLRIIGAPFRIGIHQITIGSSIGVGLYPGDGETPDVLMKNADLALYEAKQAGRGMCCFFAAEMASRQHQKLLLEQELRVAMERGEMLVHYQPQFAADGTTLTGYEALVRWQHKVRGMVSPADFIPVAEACGLIVELGAWVLETACAEAAGWERPYQIAVNLSPVQLRQTDLAQSIGAILRRTGLDPHRLELELTEGVLISDPGHALATMTEVKRLGVRIALDDYGTGYSSLNYLSRFAFDKIKIDASYVRNLGDRAGEVIIGSIIELGHGLGMVVTAEGVETDAQLAALRNYGCDQFQGFLLGRPVPGNLLYCLGTASLPRMGPEVQHAIA